MVRRWIENCLKTEGWFVWMDSRVLWIVKCPKYIHEGHDAGVVAIHWQYFLFSTSMISSSIVVQKRNTLAIYNKFTSFSEKNNCTQILRRVRLCLAKSSQDLSFPQKEYPQIWRKSGPLWTRAHVRLCLAESKDQNDRGSCHALTKKPCSNWILPSCNP